jgi:hypothetical protein
MDMIEKSYELAKEHYAAFGIDTLMDGECF